MSPQDATPDPKPATASDGKAPKDSPVAKTQVSQRPTPNGTARRPGPPKPTVFKDFASI